MDEAAASTARRRVKNKKSKAIAAADLGEAQVDSVMAHKGTAKKRSSVEFQIQWSDGDITWEPWDRVKKLAAVDEYVKAFKERDLKGLMG